ncbi:MAG: hypothetical protein HY020_05250 [Burkholderiales bacterium]|nr:hypothetical protein [Burkholderiales bacterium]
MVDAEWRRIRYRVFELPAGKRTLEQQADNLESAIVVPGEQQHFRSNAEFRAKLKQVVDAGGAGLMLHRADVLLASGRRDLLLKLKPLTDASVVGHAARKDRFAGQMGTGFSDAQRRVPPPIGATVTDSYKDLTPARKPRFASFLCVADEL